MRNTFSRSLDAVFRPLDKVADKVFGPPPAKKKANNGAVRKPAIKQIEDREAQKNREETAKPEEPVAESVQEAQIPVNKPADLLATTAPPDPVENMLVKVPLKELVPPEAGDPFSDQKDKVKPEIKSEIAKPEPAALQKEVKTSTVPEPSPKKEEAGKGSESLLSSIFDQVNEEKESPMGFIIDTLPDITAREICDDLAKVKVVMRRWQAEEHSREHKKSK